MKLEIEHLARVWGSCRWLADDANYARPRSIKAPESKRPSMPKEEAAMSIRCQEVGRVALRLDVGEVRASGTRKTPRNVSEHGKKPFRDLSSRRLMTV